MRTEGTESWPALAREWIGWPVRLGAVQLGTVADVIANETAGHIFGFEVRDGRATANFLPWVAAEVGHGSIEVRSVFSLLSPQELAIYLDHGVRLSELLAAADDEGESLGDLLVDRHGDVVALVLANGAFSDPVRSEAPPSATQPTGRRAA
jgi:hypothetical protein